MIQSTDDLQWPLKTYPRIRHAGHFPISEPDFRYRYQSATHALHLHEYDGVIDMDGKKFPLSPGTITLSPAGGITRYALPLAGRHWCVHFEVQPQRKPLVRLPRHLALGQSQSYVAQRMAHITQLHAAQSHNLIAHTAASVALQELLLHLAHQQPPATSRHHLSQADQAVDQLLKFINQNLDQPLRVALLADTVQLSQNYLARHFRQRMGITIPRYILQTRIERAQLLLKTTNLPVKQIAAQVGMSDPQHFNKQFRHLTGTSPTALRNQ